MVAGAGTQWRENQRSRPTGGIRSLACLCRTPPLLDPSGQRSPCRLSGASGRARTCGLISCPETAGTIRPATGPFPSSNVRRPRCVAGAALRRPPLGRCRTALSWHSRARKRNRAWRHQASACTKNSSTGCPAVAGEPAIPPDGRDYEPGTDLPKAPRRAQDMVAGAGTPKAPEIRTAFGTCPPTYMKRSPPYGEPLSCSGSGGWIRTSDLQVMSLTSFLTAPPRDCSTPIIRACLPPRPMPCPARRLKRHHAAL